MSEQHTLKTEIEKAAKEFGLDPSTIGKCAGQGGHFYRRICSGKRFWPETAAKVRRWIEEERKRRSEASERAAE